MVPCMVAHEYQVYGAMCGGTWIPSLWCHVWWHMGTKFMVPCVVAHGYQVYVAMYGGTWIPSLWCHVWCHMGTMFMKMLLPPSSAQSKKSVDWPASNMEAARCLAASNPACRGLFKHSKFAEVLISGW